MKTYAVKMSKKHKGLLTLLGAETPVFEKGKERFILFTVDNAGTVVASDVVTKRALLQYNGVGAVEIYHMK